jgi:hypothetical protein
MGMDLFRISQQSGIYHTLSLWSMLSPHLVKSDRPPKDGLPPVEQPQTKPEQIPPAT